MTSETVTAKNGYKELIYTPGNDVILTSRREYFDSILVDGKEVLTSGSGRLIVDTLVNPVVKIRFKYWITKFTNCFRYCENLISIPEDLFSDNLGIVNLADCFEECTSLTSIPEGLFRYNPEVLNFYYCFKSCTSLTSIPKDLFRYNTKVTDFAGCFKMCYDLTSIPGDLFSYNTRVYNITDCFYGCSKLKTMPIDSDGTPIYNRSTPGKSGYSTVGYYGDCFYRCDSIEGYSEIPSGWK